MLKNKIVYLFVFIVISFAIIFIVSRNIDYSNNEDPKSTSSYEDSKEIEQINNQNMIIYLHKNNLQASMSRSGTPIDNSPIESFFSTLKAEWLSNTTFMTIAEIGLEIDEYINFYNNERIQLKTGTAPSVVRARAA
jgi:transposase InsO family protein